VISGGSGFLGSRLAALLRARGHVVESLSRRRRAPGDILWDPASGTIEAERLEGCDALVHLAGANLAAGRWTRARKREIWSSRIDGARLLVEAIKSLSRPPRR